MLLLQFVVDDTRYALESGAVVEVASLVRLKKVPNAAAYIAGLMDYRGRPVPVVDICQLFSGRACAQHLSSRIIVVRTALRGGEPREIGLLVEKATETLKMDDSAFSDPGVDNPATPYLGQVAMDPRGMIQKVSAGDLLSKIDIELLFSATD